MILGIYSTVYNNAHTIKKTLNTFLKSIDSLFDKIIIVVVDNYSTDGTYEKLKILSKKVAPKVTIEIIRKQSTRGLGRQIALQVLLNNHDPDIIAYIDWDLIFLPYAKQFYQAVLEHIKDNELFNHIGTSTTYRKILKRNISWPDMNILEDWIYDFLIMAKTNIALKVICTKIALNEEVSIPREYRYSRGLLQYYMRILKNKLDHYNAIFTVWNQIIQTSGISLKKKLYFFFRSLSIVEMIENARIYILPEEIELPNSWFYYYSEIVPKGLLSKIFDDYSVKYTKIKNLYHLFRDLNFAKLLIKNVERVIHNISIIDTIRPYPIRNILQEPFILYY